MYVTISSNASKAVYGDSNTSSNFKNLLSQPLDLSSGDYEVAIKKIIYHNSFKTIVNEAFEIHKHVYIEHKQEITLPSNIENAYGMKFGPLEITNYEGRLVILQHSSSEYKHSKQFKLVFPSKKEYTACGYKNDSRITVYSDYRTFMFNGSKWSGQRAIADIEPPPPEEEGTDINFTIYWYNQKKKQYSIIPASYSAIESILAQLNSKSDIINFSYENGRVSVEFNDKSESINLLNGLHYILGFKDKDLTESQTARFPPQLNRGLFAIFIYSNICSYSHVGDSLVPLLNVISMPSANENQIISIDVNNPMYVPVLYNTVREIEIKLTSDTGEELPFDSDMAKSIITLHFRKRV